MCTHLTKRQSVYYFRRVIPKNLQPYFDHKKQWMHSLQTKDYSEGKRLARLAGIETDRMIDEATARLLSGSGPTSPYQAERGNEIAAFEPWGSNSRRASRHNRFGSSCPSFLRSVETAAQKQTVYNQENRMQ